MIFFVISNPTQPNSSRTNNNIYSLFPPLNLEKKMERRFGHFDFLIAIAALYWIFAALNIHVSSSVIWIVCIYCVLAVIELTSKISYYHKKTVVGIKNTGVVARQEPPIDTSITDELESLSQVLDQEQTITAGNNQQHPPQEPVVDIISGSEGSSPSPTPNYEKTVNINGNYQYTPEPFVVDIDLISNPEILSDNESTPSTETVASETNHENRLFEPASAVSLCPTPPPVVQLSENENLATTPNSPPTQDPPLSFYDRSFNFPPTPQFTPEEYEPTEQLIPRDWDSESELPHSDELEPCTPLLLDPNSDATPFHCRGCDRTYFGFNEGSISDAAFESTWPYCPVHHPGVMCGNLRRIFQPCHGTVWRGAIDPDTLVRYHSKFQISNFLVSRKANGLLYPRLHTMVVVVDGACPGNGTTRARTAVGAFFGPGSRYNCCSQLSPSLFRQTSNVAEATSTLLALRKIQSEVLHHSKPRIKQVVIITDSEYVVKSLTERVWRWIENGFKTTKGKNVKNAGLLLEIHRTIEGFQDDFGVDVRFWRVDREFVQEARDLANEPFTEYQQVYDRLLDSEICEECPFTFAAFKKCPHGLS
ncbi:hypothetical protein EV426DRAFT_626204 [Tirmania nivea]|nr:hypothetical protein EV426DRAFT_626204 [Tirmania nivea]